jgi:hypothetical protein
VVESIDGGRIYNGGALVCPLCDYRKARRGCPALGKQICAVCCGTKRLTEIACPGDCPYLAAAREHPPAVVMRQQQHDLASLVRFVRDLNDRQSRLFFMIITFLARYEAPELQPLIDDDIAQSMAALAGTFETASRGVIYEHRPRSLSAERVVSGLKPLLTEAGQTGGTPFQRDAGVVLRRLETAAAEVMRENAGNRRAFLDMLGRFTRQADNEAAATEPPDETPRVIIP